MPKVLRNYFGDPKGFIEVEISTDSSPADKYRVRVRGIKEASVGFEEVSFSCSKASLLLFRRILKEALERKSEEEE